MSGVSAKHLLYWDYDPEAELVCGDCGWTGPGGLGEMFAERFDVSCPRCDRMLLIVSFPTLEETRQAAAAGNVLAQAELPNAESADARWRRAVELQLEEPEQLPELPGAALQIDWDFETHDDEIWTVLRHDGTEIWRELAFYDGYERFETVFRLLRKRYGGRLAEVRPTPESKFYLFGDSLGAPRMIDDLNASLGE